MKEDDELASRVVRLVETQFKKGATKARGIGVGREDYCLFFTAFGMRSIASKYVKDGKSKEDLEAMLKQMVDEQTTYFDSQIKE